VVGGVVAQLVEALPISDLDGPAGGAGEQPAALAGAIGAALRQQRRTHPSTQAIVEERFRAEAVARQYFAIYAGVARP